jgi:lipoprotein-anchoring transpeptidase ErfK/SrfK
MSAPPSRISRRAFLQAAALGLGSLALPPWLAGRAVAPRLADFPQAERLGRVLGGMMEVKARADENSPTVKKLLEDTIVVWQREVVGSRPLWNTQRYVETPDGFIYAPNVQPVRNQPNQPLTALPQPEGMWVEVSVPYVDLTVANPPGRAPWLDYTTTPRLYYSQVMWVDQIRTDEQRQTWYRVSDRYGGFGDFFWAPAEGLRPLTAEDMSPIHPDATDKRVVVNLNQQVLSCYEGDHEVYFCRVSTGPRFENTSKKVVWATPPGTHTIWRKLVSVHMTGGTTGGGYDLCGIGWTTLFATQGMAIHSTFWHNSYGVPTSHGCVNAAPEDAHWVFRWTLPVVPIEPGDLTVAGRESTQVTVVES